jgi:hypothetical protein
MIIIYGNDCITNCSFGGQNNILVIIILEQPVTVSILSLQQEQHLN